MKSDDTGGENRPKFHGEQVIFRDPSQLADVWL